MDGIGSEEIGIQHCENGTACRVGEETDQVIMAGGAVGRIFGKNTQELLLIDQ